MVITGSLVATGVVYGFSLCAGFKILGSIWDKLKNVVHDISIYIYDRVMIKYGDRINAYVRNVKGADAFYRKLVRAILNRVLEAYSRLSYGMSLRRFRALMDCGIDMKQFTV